MTYKKDTRGEYRVQARWIDTWQGPGYVSGWSIEELREYMDGSLVVHQCEPRYLEKESAEFTSLFNIYKVASKGLGL
jgi:hypothetical protein